MKFAITGVTGFIGMHLVKFLYKSGHEVIYSCDSEQPIYGSEIAKLRHQVIDIEACNFETLDLSTVSPEIFAKKIQGADVVIHLAANAGVRQSALTPYAYSQSNLNAFANVLEAVRLAKPELFMFASSSSVYGKKVLNANQTENLATGLDLASYYAATKWSNEILAQTYSDNFKINTVGLRFFTVYGSFGRPDMAYWTFAKKVLRNEPVDLYGDDGGHRSFSHVSDIVGVVRDLACSNSLKNELSRSEKHFKALNIGNSESTSALGMLNQIGIYLNKTPNVHIVARPSYDVDKTWASMEETFKFVEERKFKTLEVGLKEFIEWFAQLPAELQ